MIDELRIGWAALRESPSPVGADLLVQPLPGIETPLGSVLIGMDGHRRSHLLVPAEGVGPEDSGVRAVRVGSRPLVVASKPREFVDIVLEASGLAEVFDHFAIAVLDQVARTPGVHPGGVAIEVLDSWRRFLVQDGRSVSPERLAPLFAEMLVLADVASHGHDAVEAWRGPGARHDFARGRCGLEVKATRAHTAREVTIHGIDQLEPLEGGELFLEFVRLEEAVDDGRSVPDLVDQVLAAGVPASSLYAAVERAGLAPAQYGEARDIRFRVRERSVLPVTEGFPRIVSASFADGSAPAGIRDVVYRADLEVAMSARLHKTAVQGVYATLAGVAA